MHGATMLLLLSGGVEGIETTSELSIEFRSRKGRLEGKARETITEARSRHKSHLEFVARKK